jgi:hypothetical protein
MAGERRILFNDYFDSTLGANVVRYFEAPFPVTFEKAKCWASNDSSATLAISGASKMSIAAQVIGDSADPRTIEPTAAEKASTAGEPADSLITITLDYDGTSGTAAENVHLLIWFLTGED